MELNKKQYEAIKATFDELPKEFFIIESGTRDVYAISDYGCEVELDTIRPVWEYFFPMRANCLNNCTFYRRNFTTSYEDSIYAIT